jgi:hypothetical protein
MRIPLRLVLLFAALLEWHTIHTLENGNVVRFQERYVCKLVREASSFDNVIFEIQNEPWFDRLAAASVINPYLRPPALDTFPNVVEGVALSYDETAHAD